MATLQQLSPGDWIEIQLPTDAWPVHITIGKDDPVPAFIDHVRGKDGIETWAKIRCPQLKRGSHRVTATTSDGSVEHTVSVR